MLDVGSVRMQHETSTSNSGAVMCMGDFKAPQLRRYMLIHTRQPFGLTWQWKEQPVDPTVFIGVLNAVVGMLDSNPTNPSQQSTWSHVKLHVVPIVHILGGHVWSQDESTRTKVHRREV